MRTLRLALTLAGLVVFGAAQAQAGEMEKDYYSGSEGSMEYTVGAPFNVVDRPDILPLKPKWEADLGGAVFHAEPVGARIIAMALNGVYALDINDGKVLWKFDQYGGMPSKVVVRENRVFFSTFIPEEKKEKKSKLKGYTSIQVLDLETGQPLWQKETWGGQYTALGLEGDIFCAVLAIPDAMDPERVGILQGLGSRDGKELWVVDVGEKEKGYYADAVLSHGVVAVANNRSSGDLWVYGLFGYNAADGQELWRRVPRANRFTAAFQMTRIEELRVTGDGTLYPLVGKYKKSPKSGNESHPFALDIKTGNPIWEKKGITKLLPWPRIGYLVSDRYLYGYGVAQEGVKTFLSCNDITTGDELWRETIQSRFGKVVAQLAWDATRTAVAEARAQRQADADARRFGSGSATYKVYHNPYAHLLSGNDTVLFTHQGTFVNRVGDDEVRRYVGDKEIWSFKHKAKEPVLPNQIFKNLFVLGDESGSVRFIDVATGKVTETLDKGARVHNIFIDQSGLYIATDAGLSVY